MRLDDNHPRKAAINKTVKHKLKTRSSFRERAKALISPLSISHAPRAPFPRVLPQTVEESSENWTIVTNQDIKHSIPEIGSRIENLQADLYIYTDGSCTGGVRDGGAAAVITDGSFENPNCIEAIEQRGNRHTLLLRGGEESLTVRYQLAAEPPRVQKGGILHRQSVSTTSNR